MRKTFVKIISRKIDTAAILSDPAAHGATPIPDDANSQIEFLSSNIQSHLKFIRKEGKYFLFDVVIENPDNNPCVLEVRNDSGAIVAAKDFSEKNVRHEIKLSNEELTAHFNFSVKAAGKEADHTFIVSITTKTLEKVQAA